MCVFTGILVLFLIVVIFVSCYKDARVCCIVRPKAAVCNTAAAASAPGGAADIGTTATDPSHHSHGPQLVSPACTSDLFCSSATATAGWLVFTSIVSHVLPSVL